MDAQTYQILTLVLTVPAGHVVPQRPPLHVGWLIQIPHVGRDTAVAGTWPRHALWALAGRCWLVEWDSWGGAETELPTWGELWGEDTGRGDNTLTYMIHYTQIRLLLNCVYQDELKHMYTKLFIINLSCKIQKNPFEVRIHFNGVGEVHTIVIRNVQTFFETVCALCAGDSGPRCRSEGAQGSALRAFHRRVRWGEPLPFGTLHPSANIYTFFCFVFPGWDSWVLNSCECASA